MKLDQRSILILSVRAILALLILAMIFILLDYAIDFRPRQIHRSYLFTIKDDIALDEPLILKQDNLAILVIKRSEAMIDTLLSNSIELQDDGSNDSQQPLFASNTLRSRHRQYFVSYGFGTDLGCQLSVGVNNFIREVCSAATYDFAGRAIAGKNQFQNLAIPDYNFNDDFTKLTIRP